MCSDYQFTIVGNLDFIAMDLRCSRNNYKNLVESITYSSIHGVIHQFHKTESFMKLVKNYCRLYYEENLW